ncbi:hypothetical protein LTR66_013391, partial [Elasticomyces elasticus]
KVSQAGDQGKDELEQAEPKPIDDAEDTVSGAQETAEETASDGEDIADDATEKAGDTADDTAEDTAEDTDDTQETAGDVTDDAQKTADDTTKGAKDTAGKTSEGLLSGAKGLAGKASGLANKVAQDPSKAARDAPDDVQEAAKDVADDAQKVADDAAETAEDATDDVKETAQDAAEKAQDAAEKAQDAADDAKDAAGDVDEDEDEADGVTKKVKDVADKADDVADKAGDVADEAGDATDSLPDTAEEGVDGVKDKVEEGVESVEDTAEKGADGVKDTAGEGTKDAQATAEEGAEDAKATAEEGVEGATATAEDGADAEDTAEAATGQEAPELPLDLSVLKGLEVQQDGTVLDNEGKPIGKLVEGDAEDLQGYPIGDDGEILDDDGDLVGRVELLPEEQKRQLQELKNAGELPKELEEQLDGQLDDAEEEEEVDITPGVEILKGLKCDSTGQIFDEDGNVVGQVVEGNPADLQNAMLNENGEFVDKDGNVLGRAKLSDEVEESPLFQEAKEAAEEAQKAAEDAAGDAHDAAEDAQNAAEDAKDTADGIEDELPGVEALQGRELNEAGEILDAAGNVLGEVDEDSDLKQKLESGEVNAKDLEVNEAGEVLDNDGNVVGNVALAEGAADKLRDSVPLDLRILEGKKVNKKGKILDEEGEEIGSLVEGDAAECAGKTVDDKGQVLDKSGKVLGRVHIVPGEAAEEATKAMLKQLSELEDTEETTPDLDILEGLKVNKKGQVLDEDGEPVGELIEGDIAKCAGKKINDQGEVLDAKGKVIGKCRTLPQEISEAVDDADAAQEGAQVAEDGAQSGEEGAEDAEKGAEGAEEDAQLAAEEAKDAAREAEDAAADAGPQLPPLSILEGLTCNKSGKLVDSNGTIVGELVEGDAKKLAKSGITCDNEGQFWDNKGHVIGKATTVQVEDPDEEAPFAGLDGLIVVKDGYVQDENGNTVGVVVEGDAKKLVGRSVDEDGDILDKKGSVVGHAERYEEPEAPEPEEPEIVDMSFLEGKTVNKQGNVIGDEGVPVARLVEGNVKELAGKKLDDKGQIWNDSGKVIGRCELIPENEREAKPEGVFAGLQGLRVIAGGKVADEDDNVVGEIVEGNPKRLIGLAVDEDGDIIDKYGNVKGHAEPLPDEEEPEIVIDNSPLEGKVLNKSGYVVDDNGAPIGKLVEGNLKELSGRRCDDQGLIYNDTGKVVGRCEVLPENERPAKPEGPFAGLEGLRVIKDGKVADEDDNVVGEIVEGNAKRLIGLRVDEDGDIIDKYGNVKGHAEPIEDEPEVVEDNSILEGKVLNKQGFVVNENRIPIGKLVEGNVKELAGRLCDDQGLIHGDTGKVVGRCVVLPENERVARPEGPFAGLEGLKVIKDGKVEDADGNIVGVITEGDPKRLVGHTVDEDGDIIDKYGNVKGHAEPYEEEEVAPEDLSILAGCTVNKAGNVVDSSGTILGRVAEGDPSVMIGKRVDGKGQIWDSAGNVIGRAELVHGAASGPEGPFAGFDIITVAKDGTVRTPSGEIVGRVIEGDVKKLEGHKVDEDGDITDKNGNSIGKAQRWEPEEKERRVNPMSGRRVNKDGEVRDEEGNLMGRLTAGDLGHCAGLEIDDNGYVIDNDGNKVGEVTLLENIVEEEEEEAPEMTEEEMEAARLREQDRQIAEKMGNICQQTLERVQPVCKQITEYIEKADRTPKEELDEEELVNNVKPLIEEGGRILQECNGSLRGLDPDGRIAAQAKGRAGTKEASPEEYRLADTLKELTTTVVTTIDNAKKKLNDMPHAKKKLNPLWFLLSEPLFQIVAAVGLLLAGVLGIVGRLLNGLGLGGLVNGLLGGLGIDKLLGGLGLGNVAEGLGLGGKKKKKSGGGVGSLPIVGGMLGGGK